MADGPTVAFFGSSLVSSWWNGAATYYRGVIRGLAALGYRVTFYEPIAYERQEHRDIPDPDWAEVVVYPAGDEGQVRATVERGRGADVVVKTSGVGVFDDVLEDAVLQLGGPAATVYWDVDAPATLARLEADRGDPFRGLLPGDGWGARRARAFHCLVDPSAYAPTGDPPRWDLGYLGTYGPDRQPVLDRLLVQPARQSPAARFVVAGPQYPDDLAWPGNVERIEHLPPPAHRGFYGAQRFTLNVTRADMVAAGWSPSVRLFEAAACGVPIISDWWEGLDRFFRPDTEILVAADAAEVLRILAQVDDERRASIAAAARTRVLAEHTAEHRAAELEAHVAPLLRTRHG